MDIFSPKDGKLQKRTLQWGFGPCGEEEKRSFQDEEWYSGRDESIHFHENPVEAMCMAIGTHAWLIECDEAQETMGQLRPVPVRTVLADFPAKEILFQWIVDFAYRQKDLLGWPTKFARELENYSWAVSRGKRVERGYPGLVPVIRQTQAANRQKWLASEDPPEEMDVDDSNWFCGTHFHDAHNILSSLEGSLSAALLGPEYKFRPLDGESPFFHLSGIFVSQMSDNYVGHYPEWVSELNRRLLQEAFLSQEEANPKGVTYGAAQAHPIRAGSDS
jgi:hypothetical protein